MGSLVLAFRALGFLVLTGLGLVCILQTGCSVFPVSAKPIPEPTSNGSQTKKCSAKETTTDSPKGKDNQLLQAAILESPDKDSLVPSTPNSNQPPTPNKEGEECPVLEVASKVFPDTEKNLVSNEVILADLTKPGQASASNTDGGQAEALGIPPLYIASQPKSPALDISGQKSQVTSPSKHPGSIAKAHLVSDSTPGPDSPQELASAKPKGVEPFHFTKLILCKRVDGFGQYEPVAPGYRFCPGTAGFPGERILLYAEMASPPGYSAEGTFRTKLAGEVEILRQNDRTAVCKLGFPGREDCSRTARKDHHLVYSFHVPPGLPPGTYTLRVNARDCSQKTSGPEKISPESTQTSAMVDFEVDVGRGQSEGARDKTLLPAGGGKTK